MHRILTISLLFVAFYSNAQDVLTLTSDMFDVEQKIMLADTGEWVFHEGNDIRWADPLLNTAGWSRINPDSIHAEMANEDGMFEGWFRLKFRLDSSLQDMQLGLIQKAWAATDIYLDGDFLFSFGNTGSAGEPYEEYKRVLDEDHKIVLDTGEHVLAIHAVDKVSGILGELKSEGVKHGFINITGPEFIIIFERDVRQPIQVGFVSILALLTVLFWSIYFFSGRSSLLLMIAFTSTLFTLTPLPTLIDARGGISFFWQVVLDRLASQVVVILISLLPLLIVRILEGRVSRMLKWYFIANFVAILILGTFQVQGVGDLVTLLVIISFLLVVYLVIKNRRLIKGPNWAIVAGLISTLFGVAVVFGLAITVGLELPQWLLSIIAGVMVLGIPLSLLVYVGLWLRNVMNQMRLSTDRIVEMTKEKQAILQNQNQRLEEQVEDRTKELNDSLENLKSTQRQLVQSEKMASLGELTAGIAHEIQNPLNFVNNFSDVNKELVVELVEEIENGNYEEAKAIANDIAENEEKIEHHGKRAEGIVRSMLQHSRGSEGKKEPTDINALADEYLRLAYHGMRAKDKSFNAEFKFEPDESIQNISVVPQDIGRVLLNLINNSFQAIKDVEKPLVTVSTAKDNGKVEIKVKDNGPGIPDEIKEKIFQPFFTTKGTGEGTGLGLSISYDIISKGHGGELKVENSEGNGTVFLIILPLGDQ